jgi:hypothetical protein
MRIFDPKAGLNITMRTAQDITSATCEENQHVVFELQPRSSADAERALAAVRDWLHGLSNETVGWFGIGTVVTLSATWVMAAG